MTDVKNIASQLNYPEAAQIMAIKGMLPIEIYNACLNINALNDLKDFLINVFDNPKVQNSYAVAKDSEPSGSAFSMVKNVDTQSPAATTEMGELISKIDSIELSLHSLNKRGPYIPRVSQSRLDSLTIIHASFKMKEDQAKTPPNIPIIII